MLRKVGAEESPKIRVTVAITSKIDDQSYINSTHWAQHLSAVQEQSRPLPSCCVMCDAIVGQYHTTLSATAASAVSAWSPACLSKIVPPRGTTSAPEAPKPRT